MPFSSTTIFLIGYRGTGKSAVARLVAERLGWQDLDMDALIESRRGLSIREMFAQEGEAAFRRLECDLLREIAALPRHVVATGGGVILDADNRACLQSSGQVIWLTAKPETLWQRISQDATTWERRPDLGVGGLAEIEHLLQVREPYYRQCANFIVATDDRTPEEVAREILTQVNRE
ncbi:MAG: shikimate kinase [Gemmataceae bacterium]